MGKHSITKDDIEPKINNKNSKKFKNKPKKHIKLKIFFIIVILLGIFIGKRIYDADGNLLAALLGHN